VTTSRSKATGSAAERYVAGMLGGHRVGQVGGPVDVRVPGYMDVQVKAVTIAPSLPAVRRMITAMARPPGWAPGPVEGYLQGEAFPDDLGGHDGPLRGVVIVSRPGAGHRVEVTITFDFREFCEWHGHPEATR